MSDALASNRFRDCIRFQMTFLNVGCGSRFHPEWINIDLVSTDKSVRAYDLRQGIPFPDSSFDFVYHSHVLEHIEKSRASDFVFECVRVLKPGGILRVVLPDLERIAREYLRALENASLGDANAEADYDWMMLEFYDQCIREKSGGDMAVHLCRESLLNEPFVERRMGPSLLRAVKMNRAQALCRKSSSGSQLLRIIRAAVRIVMSPRYQREWMLRLLLGKEYALLQMGRFREAGEIHRWMYDRFSLGRLLRKAGLVDIVVRGAGDSYLPDWASYSLDVEEDGSVVKPDSLFLEGRKPIPNSDRGQ